MALARAALSRGGTAPTVLNAANEIAVAAFLAGRIGFLQVVDIVEAALERCESGKLEGLADILAVDAEARRIAEHLIGGSRTAS